MKSLYELNQNTRDYLNRSNMIENYLWEIARTIYPGRFIDPATMNKIKEELLESFKILSERKMQ